MKFRHKPTVVDAIQWNGDSTSLPKWLSHAVGDGRVHFVACSSDRVLMLVETIAGVVVADQGDWVVLGPSGEIYPAPAAAFFEFYEEVDTSKDLI